MAGIKRLKKKGDATVIGNENNDVTLNGRTTVRVTINGSDVVWERPAPNHKWSFEEASGDFIDSENGKILSDTDMVQRVPSMHPELGQAIELDAGFEILTSKPYPYLAVEGVMVSPDVTGSQLINQPVEGASLGVSVISSNLYEPVVTYTDGEPEGADVTVDVISSNLYEPVVTYTNGEPEGAGVTIDVISCDLRVVAIPYTDGEPEGADLTIDVVSSNLYT